MASTSFERILDCNFSCARGVRSINVERSTLIEQEGSPMQPFNLFALVDDRRAAREREARFERLRRRSKPERAAATPTATCRGSLRHAPGHHPAA
jgi:hypothetical protein